MRWLLLGSLALNLFFIGAGGAFLLQGYRAAPIEAPAVPDRSVAGRIERIAAALPPADGARLREAFQGHRTEIERVHAAYRERREAIRTALRASPFDAEALRTAMAEARAARQIFDRRIQDFLAEQAAGMTPEGRRELADWPRRGAARTSERGSPGR
jgi:uncharacterized membrane protein